MVWDIQSELYFAGLRGWRCLYTSRVGKYSTNGICRMEWPSYPEIRKGVEHMARISAKAMALVAALLWGGCLLLVGIINLGAPSYGADFLRMMSSVYPGFHDTRTWGEVILGTVYGFVDGAIAGLLFAWLYNWAAHITAHETGTAAH